MRPLSGVTVVDASAFLAGPFTGVMLADLGADVIKVEAPTGDPLRRFGYKYRDVPLGVGFALINRDKRSVVLDLRSEAGHRDMLALLAEADVLLENWRPGVADRLGLDDATLEKTNPRLLHLALTGYGPDGPYATSPAFDTVMQAQTAYCHAKGPAAEPEIMYTYVADKVTSVYAVQAILAGLLARERGQGAGRIDVSMLDACAYFGAPDLLETRMVVSESYDDPPRSPGPSTLLRCADGHAVVAPSTGAQIARACAALGHPEWVEQLRALKAYTDLAPKLIRLMTSVTETLPVDEVVRLLSAADVPAAAALDYDGLLAHPQVAHNGTFQEYDDVHFGRVRRVRYPAVGSAWDDEAPSTTAPPLGEHTAEVLAQLKEVSTDG